MKQKLLLLALFIFALGVLVGQLVCKESEGGIVYIKEFTVVDASSGEQLNCSIQTPSILSGEASQLLLEMPPGGPYRATTSLKTMASLTVSAEGYVPTQIDLEPFKATHSMGGRISTDTIELEKVPNQPLEATGVPPAPQR